MSFLVWGRWEQTILGKRHSEMGAALLARLVEKLRLNPNSSSLDDCFDPTCTMAPTCGMTQSSWYGATSIPLYAKLVMVS